MKLDCPACEKQFDGWLNLYDHFQLMDMITTEHSHEHNTNMAFAKLIDRLSRKAISIPDEKPSERLTGTKRQ